MEQKKEKGLRIRSCLTGAIWLALVFSTVISALLFAILNHFFNLPGSIPVLGWLLIFNTLIAGLITSFINAKLLEPITRLSKAMKEVSRGDFEQHLETNSRIEMCIRDRNNNNNNMISVPEGVDADMLMKVLGNPEMAALLTSLAKSMKG